MQCGIHKVIIVAIIEKDVIKGEQLEWLKSKILSDMILRINFTTDGHDGISESSHKHASLNYEVKLKKSNTY